MSCVRSLHSIEWNECECRNHHQCIDDDDVDDSSSSRAAKQRPKHNVCQHSLELVLFETFYHKERWNIATLPSRSELCGTAIPLCIVYVFHFVFVVVIFFPSSHLCLLFDELTNATCALCTINSKFIVLIASIDNYFRKIFKQKKRQCKTFPFQKVKLDKWKLWNPHNERVDQLKWSLCVRLCSCVCGIWLLCNNRQLFDVCWFFSLFIGEWKSDASFVVIIITIPLCETITAYWLISIEIQANCSNRQHSHSYAIWVYFLINIICMHSDQVELKWPKMEFKFQISVYICVLSYVWEMYERKNQRMNGMEWKRRNKWTSKPDSMRAWVCVRLPCTYMYLCMKPQAYVVRVCWFFYRTELNMLPNNTAHTFTSSSPSWLSSS